MNLFLRECKSNLKTFCLWSIGIIFLVLISAGKTTSMVGQENSGIDKVLEQLPKSIQTVFGVGTVDYSTAIGVFAIVFTYVALIAAFHAVTVGVSAFGKEERDRTFEFLYVKGRTRSFILSGKLASGLLQIILLNIIAFAGTIGSVKVIFNDNITSDYLPMAIGMFFIQLIFFGIGLLSSFLCVRLKTASNISMAIVIVTFLMSIAADFSEKIDWLRYFTPFKYFDGKEMLNDGVTWGYAGICTAAAVICIVIAYSLHEKRDLHC